MSDQRDSYFEACAAIRLIALLTGARWAEPEDTFDLVMAAALMRARPGSSPTSGRTGCTS